MRRTRFRIVLEQNNVPRLSEDLIGTPQYEAAVRAMIAYEQAVTSDQFALNHHLRGSADYRRCADGS